MAETTPVPPRSAMSVEAGRAPKPDTNDFGSGFEAENNKFAFSPGQLEKLYNPKSLGAFYALGGLEGIEEGLRMARKAGMNDAYLDNTVLIKEAAEINTVPVKGSATMPDNAASPRITPKTHPKMHRIHQKSPLTTYNPFARAKTPASKGTSQEAVSIARVSSTFGSPVSVPPAFDLLLTSLPDKRSLSTKVYQPTPFAIHKEIPVMLLLTVVLYLVQCVLSPRSAVPAATLLSPLCNSVRLALSLREVTLWSTLLATKLEGLSEWLGVKLGTGVRTVSRFSSRNATASPLLGRLWIFLFFALSHAQGPESGPRNKVQLDWRQRALGALTDNVVMLAFLFFPLMVLTITGCAADRFRRKSQEGKAAMSMLGMAVIFIAIPVSPEDKGVSNNDRYMRGAIGLSYTFFMTVYCVLIALRHRWYKGRCAIAGGLAILMTIVSMASTSVQSYWTNSTKTDPIFALSIAIPASFTLCDLIAYLSNAFDDARAPSLPAPVPGPQQGA
jgi:hypothetical protein